MQRKNARTGVAFLTLAMIGGLLVGGSLPASGRTSGGARVQPTTIQRLRSDAEGAVTVSIDRGTRFVGFARVSEGGDLFPASASATPKGKARGFFGRYAALYGIQDATAELREVSSVRDAYGFTHITYEQRYRGLPVFGGVIRAHLDRANSLTAVNGTFTPNVNLDVTPLLSASQAGQKAIAEVRANPPLSDENADDAAPAAPTGLRVASVTLEVYRMGLVRNVPGSNQLVYEVEVTNGADVREFVFVHANAGKIVNRYSGVQSDLFRRLFEVDLQHQVWQEGDPFPGNLNIDQQHIVTFSGQAYYHFLHAFGRDSYDGLGHEMRSVNNDPRINCPNANWNGQTTNYCTGVTGDDVVAHEWAHAYTEFTDGLIYQWQSGALNESYSDIWGDLVDQINGAGTDSPGGARTVERCSTFASNWPTVIDNATDQRCAAAPAAFGPTLNTTGVTGDVVLSNDGKGSPTDGCTSPNNAQAIDGNIALVDRGTCGFTVKVANMQKVGATGVMVANNVFGGPSIMGGADPSIQIPSVMITIGQGATFKEGLAAGTVNVTMRARTGSQSSYRWLVGEDATAFGGAIRDMSDPTCIGDPGKVTDQEYFCASSDNGGVHSNSGIPNHGFALLVDGGTYNGHTVAGIGLAKAAAIYWRAQSVYQTPSTDFTDHAESLEQSCADLVGQKVNNLSTASRPATGPKPTITAGNCTSVAEMTQAVEFRNDPTEQCHFQPILQPNPPAVCGDQPARTVFSENFESPTSLNGWTLTNSGVFAGWPGLDWTRDATLPAGRPGAAAFGADPDAGDCGQGAGDISGMMSMQSPSIVVPGGTMRLSFTHYIASEQGFDGGNVWISVGGRAYTQIPTAAFLFNPYNQALVTAAGGNTNPMAGQPAFTGTDANELVSSWGTSIVDLAATGARIRAGDTVQFRFDFGMDGCAGIDGWYVDDVTVSACGAAAAATKEEVA